MEPFQLHLLFWVTAGNDATILTQHSKTELLQDIIVRSHEWWSGCCWRQLLEVAIDHQVHPSENILIRMMFSTPLIERSFGHCCELVFDSEPNSIVHHRRFIQEQNRHSPQAFRLLVMKLAEVGITLQIHRKSHITFRYSPDWPKQEKLTASLYENLNVDRQSEEVVQRVCMDGGLRHMNSSCSNTCWSGCLWRVLVHQTPDIECLYEKALTRAPSLLAVILIALQCSSCSVTQKI